MDVTFITWFLQCLGYIFTALLVCGAAGAFIGVGHGIGRIVSDKVYSLKD